MTSQETDRLRLLSQVDVFQDLNSEQLAEIATRFSTITLEPWLPLFSDRDAMEDFYIDVVLDQGAASRIHLSG